MPLVSSPDACGREGSGVNKKSMAKAAAVIEIGARQVEMVIAQTGKTGLQVLDCLVHPTQTGHDVYYQKKISFKSLRGLVEILRKYSQALQTYGVQKCRLVSATTFSEAENAALVCSQISVQTRMTVEVLGETEENGYVYFDAVQRLKEQGADLTGETLLARVGSGSLGLAVYDGSQIRYAHTVPMGALKMNDQFEALRRESKDFIGMMREYVSLLLRPFQLDTRQLGNLVLLGPDVARIAALMGVQRQEDGACGSVKRVVKLAEKLHASNLYHLTEALNITEHEAAVLCNAVTLFSGIVELCGRSQRLHVVESDLPRAILRISLSGQMGRQHQVFLSKSALACTEEICALSPPQLQEARRTAEMACDMFDRMKRLHGIESNAKLILEIAARCYERLPFDGMRHNGASALAHIEQLEIFGVNEETMQQIALVTAAALDGRVLTEPLAGYSLTEEKRLVVMKLAAMFSLAVAMNQSRRGKLKNVKLSLHEDRLMIQATAVSDAMLETWAFRRAALLFQSVFGINPELKMKLSMLQETG